MSSLSLKTKGIAAVCLTHIQNLSKAIFYKKVAFFFGTASID